jgi:hypothetical protein
MSLYRVPFKKLKKLDKTSYKNFVMTLAWECSSSWVRLLALAFQSATVLSNCLRRFSSWLFTIPAYGGSGT